MAKRINLETFCNGAFSELMNQVLVQINQNIQDPNTDAGKARTLTCTIKFKPDESRRIVSAEITAKATLAPAESLKTTMVTGKDIRTGAVEMSEYRDDGQLPGQMAMDEQGRVYDPETGEIEAGVPATGQQPRHIRDLRRAAQ